MEYWGEVALRRLLGLVGEFAMIDDCMAGRKRIGFVKVYMKVDFSRSLRSGVQILGPEGPI